MLRVDLMHPLSHTPDSDLPEYSTHSNHARRQAKHKRRQNQSKINRHPLTLVESKINVAPHPPHAKPARFSIHNLRSELRKRTYSVAHGQFLAHAERLYDAYIDNMG